MKLYRALAQDLSQMIRTGALAPGDALPSVRTLCRTRHVSPATVRHAYELLTDAGLIESRPRAGYYVAARAQHPQQPRPYTPPSRSTRLNVSDLVFETLAASRHRDTIPLGSAFPSPELFPWAKLARFLGRSARQMDPWITVESLPPGSVELRQQIARRYLKLGISIELDEIIVTAGALEALNLALQVVTKPGDTLAVESPTFYGCLQAAERSRLSVVEIPTHPTRGMDLEALEAAIRRGPVHACWCMTTLQHPTGATMPLERKGALVRLLSRFEIPLIEDDAYAELQFDSKPSPPAKSFDRAGGVLHCGSFSKCLAPGYRVGWVAAGRFRSELVRRKLEASIATSLPVQLGIAEMLAGGGYDAHLMRLRRALARQQSAALASIRQHFPAGYRVATPSGGYFLWIECPADVDALEVHRSALELGITLAPGPIFSARQQYRSFLRINCGHPWTGTMDRAIERLAGLLH
ncbi:MAG TPA: PLP-dependent aminotransferase family protein [Steroidobacteraceae bacterium]|nr:PLP-dependent aminotransferase family protein [Steroidobacteraceae bacterium]